MLTKRVHTLMLQAAIVTFCTTIAAVANAQAIVLQSTDSSYKTGSKINTSAKVEIPEGKTMIVVLPSGVTRTINGPFSAQAYRLAKSGGRFNVALFKAVEDYFKTSGATTSSVDALRSVLPRAVTLPFSWNNIYARASGGICLDKNASPTITRLVSSAAGIFTIVDLATAKKADIVFAEGVNELSWPVEIQLKNGSYGILAKGSPMYVIRIHLIEPIPADENTLQVLHNKRCVQQMKAYLRDLTTRIAPTTEQNDEVPR